jgi:hypothetical protein
VFKIGRRVVVAEALVGMKVEMVALELLVVFKTEKTDSVDETLAGREVKVAALKVLVVFVKTTGDEDEMLVVKVLDVVGSGTEIVIVST